MDYPALNKPNPAFNGRLRDVMARAVRPDGRTTVSEWAAQHRFVPSEASPKPGKWDNDYAPFLVRIMDVMSPSHPAKEVSVIKSVQIGVSECVVNLFGLVADEAPGPMLWLLGTEDIAKELAKQKIAPSINNSPRLNRLIHQQRSRDGESTVIRKSFDGGFLRISWGTSAAALRGISYRYVVCDDADAYPSDVDGEGDPANLAFMRADAFDNYKFIRISSPNNSKRSRIGPAFEAGTKERYYVPCPHCGHMQYLRWENVKYDKQAPKNAWYVCEENGCVIEHRYKRWMMRPDNGARWVAEHPERDHVSFHISGLYHPAKSWGDRALQFEAVKDSPAKLKTFINTALGEVWQEKGEVPEWERLFDQRAAYYRGQKLPKGVLGITAGIDCQNNRLECEIVGWGVGMTSWQIDYQVLPGNPADQNDPCWKKLDEILFGRVWVTDTGVDIALSMAAIDSGGHYTSRVYDYARSRPRVRAVKGASAIDAPPVGTKTYTDIDRQGKKHRRAGELWPVGTGMLKSEIYGQLQLEPIRHENGQIIGAPPGYCHFPQDADAGYFQQLCSEQLVTIKSRRGGYDKQEWQKVRERNEALDCRVYALAAAYMKGWARWSPAQWADQAAMIGAMTERTDDELPMLSMMLSNAPIKPVEGNRIGEQAKPMTPREYAAFLAARAAKERQNKIAAGATATMPHSEQGVQI